MKKKYFVHRKQCFEITKDGRTVIDTSSPKGREMRDALVAAAWDRDAGKCGICGKYVCLLEATWDHIVPRGMGGSTRNNVLDNINAVHPECNGIKGSQRDFHLTP
jgi:5-methylcytosine-specific restriction endonuclease McrA